MSKQRSGFFESDLGVRIKRVLQSMSADNTYNTTPTYSPNSVRYPDNLIPFVDKHMNYLNAHPQTDAWIYIANVKMGTRLR